MADIVKIKDRAGVIAEIQQNSVMSLPNQPRMTPEDLKKQFVKPIIDTNKSLVNAIDTVIDEINEKIPSDIDTHNESDLSHADIRQALANNASAISSETLSRQSADNALDGRIDVLEAFKSNLDTDITDEITQAVATEKTAREEADAVLDNKKVDKVENKSLVADTEIERLALVDNYDDSEITQDLSTHTGDTVKHVTQADKNKWNALENYDDTTIKADIAEAKAIAEGKARARVFATVTALDTWLAIPENVALLLVGDNFYIEETDKPDYWWNGTNKVKLETEKVDLTEYAKTADLPPQLALGTLATQAYYGDLGHEAYQHSQATHAPSNAQKNVQSDWNQTDNTKDDYIKNKPTIPTIPDITVNNGSAESGKYISQVEVDATNKHKLNITKENLPQGFSGDYNDLTNKPTIPTIPDLALNDNTETSGKYISKIEVDSANKHKLNITKQDLPQGFSGSYNDLTDKPNVYTKDEADKLFNEIIPIYQVFTNEIGDQLSDIMFDSSYPYRPYYAYNSTSGQLYAYNETNETWGIGFAPSRSRLYYTAKFGTLTVYLYNTTTSKLENIIPTIPTLSHDIATDIANTTKTVTPNAVGNYTYSRSAIDTMIGDIETLLEAL